MSKKYLDVKKGSLEESVIDIWQTAAEEETTAEGAVKGAATGAAIGSIVPGVGTAIGGAVGALAGARRRRKGKDKYSRKALEKQRGGGEVSAKQATAAKARKATLKKKYGEAAEEFVNSLTTDDNIKAEQAFKTSMITKVGDALEVKRKELSKTFVNMRNVETEDDTEV